MLGGSLVMPWQPDFWLFMAGKVGASLGVDPQRWKLAGGLTVLAVVAAIVAVAWALRGLRRRPSEPPRAEVVTVTMLTLASTIFVYLMLVSAARSQAYASVAASGPLEVFQSGFYRFHFFWVTLIWPWVGAVALSLVLAWRRKRSSVVRTTALAVAVAAPLVAVLVAFNSGAFDYTAWYKQWAGPRMELYRCLLKNVQGDDGRGCYGLPPDVGSLIGYARSIDASWARNLQTVPQVPLGDPLFSIHDPSSGSIEFRNTDVTRDGAGYQLETADDAQLIVTVADAEAMRRCRSLEVQAEMRPTEWDQAQAFYRLPGDRVFSPKMVSTAIVGPDDAWTRTVLNLSSEEGFAETIRFDPVFIPQTVGLVNLELYCRLAAG